MKKGVIYRFVEVWDTSELTKAGIEFPFHLPFGRKLSDVSSSRGCQWIAPECILQLSDHALGLATKMDPALDMEVIIPQVDGFLIVILHHFCQPCEL